MEKRPWQGAARRPAAAAATPGRADVRVTSAGISIAFTTSG
jgi:hypothetical protein